MLPSIEPWIQGTPGLAGANKAYFLHVLVYYVVSSGLMCWVGHVFSTESTEGYQQSTGHNQTSYKTIIHFSPRGATAPSGPRPPHCRGLTITLKHTTISRTAMDEWSAWRRNCYLTTHNIRKRQTSIHRRDSNPHSQQARGRRLKP